MSGALEVDGALPALKKLVVTFSHTPNVLAELADALAGGALPLLKYLDVQQDLADEDLVEDLDKVADMVERRAQIHGCHALTFSRSNIHTNGSSMAPPRKVDSCGRCYRR